MYQRKRIMGSLGWDNAAT